MDDTKSGAESLREFLGITELLPTVQHSFPTENSVRWFVRQHRDDLVNSGAIIEVAGRLRFHPDRFQAAALSIGRTAMLKKGGAK